MKNEKLKTIIKNLKKMNKTVKTILVIIRYAIAVILGAGGASLMQ